MQPPVDEAAPHRHAPHVRSAAKRNIKITPAAIAAAGAALVALGLLSTSSAAVAQGGAGGTLVQILPNPPDPCWPAVVPLFPPPVQTFDLDPPSGEADITAGIRIYVDTASSPPLRSRPVVLIVNGNGFWGSHYADYAEFLARQGYIAAVAERPTDVVFDVDNFVLDSVALVLDHQGLASSTPVALIGHSFGGRFVLEAAVRNISVAYGLNVRAVIGLAPTIDEDTAEVGPAHAQGLMMIYGSQDNDVEGLGSEASDAFAAYDRAGSESSTTCHAQFCEFSPAIDKRMLFVHGADHAGMVNRPPALCSGSCEFPHNNYLSTQNQFCLAKGYTLAFLETHLKGATVYKRMLDGRYLPPSMAAIVTNEPDVMGNPVGTPMRLSLQQSPARRSVVENFEDGAWSLSRSTPLVDLDLIEPEELIGGVSNVRHVTRLLRVRWPEHHAWQLFGFDTPAGRRDVRQFARIGVRLGQLFQSGNAATNNVSNLPQRVYIGLWDGVQSSWVWSDDHMDIPTNDFRPGGELTHSVMNTVAIPLSAFSGVNKADIREVLFAFPVGSRGTLMLDSVEWFKD